MQGTTRFLVSSTLAVLTVSCNGPEEAPRRELPLVFAGVPERSVVTNLGYDVRLERLVIVVRDFEFAIAGETHTAGLSLPHWLIAPAHAHPGHSQGGEVTGHLDGRRALDWSAEARPLGTATLLLGDYQSANLTFERATAEDLGDESIAGSTALVAGVAERRDVSVRFEALIIAPIDRQLVGIPFKIRIEESSPAGLALEFLLRDPEEGDTLFEDVDFEVLDVDGDGTLALSETSTEPEALAAAQRVRRAFLTHDHYRIVPLGDL